MALDIWLSSDFDMKSVYNFVRTHDHFDRVSDIERGHFTFHLRGVTDVTMQIYSTGKVRLTGDDYTRYVDLVSIVADTLRLSSSKPVKLEVESINPLPTTYYEIARLSINDELSNIQGSSGRSSQELARREAERIIEVMDFVSKHNQEIDWKQGEYSRIPPN